jgi:DNA-nicking Smr family endonuclease
MAVKRAKATAKKKAPKAAEPFFRPFARLAADDAKNKKSGAAPAAAAPPPPAKSSAKRASPSVKAPPIDVEIEIDLDPALIDPRTFAIYMSGVRALPGKASRIPLTASRIERAPAGATPPPDLDVGARAQMRSLVTEGVRFETTDDGERVEGRRLDVDPRELRRLRRAQYAIDGKLDLHGHGVDDARRAVEAFVKKRAELGDKVVAIVHGKGTHSPRQNGVLRGEIGAWLSQGRAARHVLAFATPPEDEGGTGAVLVLLAR